MKVRAILIKIHVNLRIFVRPSSNIYTCIWPNFQEETSRKIILIKRLPSIARYTATLYRKSMKFDIQEEVLLSFIYFLYKMAKWRAIEGKHLIIIILRERVPFRKLGHIYEYHIGCRYCVYVFMFVCTVHVCI